MTINTKIFRAVVAIIFTTMMASCVKEELQELPAPVKGQVTLTTDWSQRELGVAIPSKYTVKLNNEAYIFDQITNTLPAMDAGKYRLYVYNTPSNIEVDGTIARVKIVDGVISDMPEHFFTSSLDVVYQDDKIEDFTAVMKQQTGQLNLELDLDRLVSSQVKDIRSKLEGIAYELDLATGEITGDGAVEVILSINNSANTRSTSAVDSSFVITFHLLGTSSRSQMLTLDITLIDGTILHSQSDMSQFFRSFNASKKTPLNLKGVVPHTPVEVGTIIGVVTDWKEAEEASVIVN